jgi:CRISPR-associated protein Cmr1
MRSPRSSTVPPVSCLAPPTVLADLRLKVVTPMFGGGVNPGEVDADRPIRAAAIRGHLRFWWRACNAAAMPTAEALHASERALWGSAAKKGDASHGPGAIGIEVTEVVPGTRFTHQEERQPNGKIRRYWRGVGDTSKDHLGHDYALFPFTRQTSPPRDALPGMVDITFRLTLTLQPHAGTGPWPDEEACTRAAEQALWAWITFGGVGSRTRRGCGALQMLPGGGAEERGVSLPASSFVPGPTDIVAWLQEKHDTLVEIGSELPLVPNLGGACINVKASQRSAIAAWRQAVEPMFRFRQEREIGRNRGGGRPGQSRWPEPGAVREIGDLTATGTDDENHAYSRTPGANGREFPRADLGLPILFQNMRNSREKPPTLEGATEGFTRMASPIILTIIAVDDTSWIPVALLLAAPHVWEHGTPGVQLKDEHIGATTPLRVGPMNQPGRQPRWPFPGNEPPFTAPAEGRYSARDAFMDYFGGTEVL